MPDFIRTQRDGRVVTLTLDRPAMRNAIGSHADCAQIVDAVERAAADPGVAAIVLTGAGSAFCAGGDLDAMRERRGIGPLDSPLASMEWSRFDSCTPLDSPTRPSGAASRPLAFTDSTKASMP